MNNPRLQAKREIKSSLPIDKWNENSEFLLSLRKEIGKHSLLKNPIISALTESVLPRSDVQKIHLEYRHAIVQVFTDALLMAQFQSRQLEPRLTPGSKMYPRFLLTLNTLDEFGFAPGFDEDNYYKGNPNLAHYPLFEQVLKDIGLSEEAIKQHQPNVLASRLRVFLESAYPSYISLLALLAVAEEQVILYSPPLKHSVKNIGINTESGYYLVHGTTDDHITEGADDDHENDLWHALTQACEPDDYADIRKLCIQYCDLWQQFWCFQHEQLKYQMRASINSDAG